MIKGRRDFSVCAPYVAQLHGDRCTFGHVDLAATAPTATTTRVASTIRVIRATGYVQMASSTSRHESSSRHSLFQLDATPNRPGDLLHQHVHHRPLQHLELATLTLI
jgi:hypothetical protein